MFALKGYPLLLLPFLSTITCSSSPGLASSSSLELSLELFALVQVLQLFPETLAITIKSKDYTLDKVQKYTLNKVLRTTRVEESTASLVAAWATA